MERYQSAGFLDRQGHFKRSIFIDVFFKGRLISSVPLKREKLERSSDIRIEGREEESDGLGRRCSIAEFRDLVFGKRLEWFQITKSTCRDAMQMCLENYPYGNPPDDSIGDACN